MVEVSLMTVHGSKEISQRERAEISSETIHGSRER